MKRFLIANVLLLFLLASCAQWSLSPDKKAELQKTYAAMLAENKITSSQYQALMDALEHGSPGAEFLGDALQTIMGIGLSLLGVRVWRGGVDNRKGVLPIVTETKVA